MTATVIPIRSVLGYVELLWSFRQWLTRRKSYQWAQALGTVEGYEFLSASKNGWLVVYYSYAFGGQSFSGEWRTWLLFSFSSIEKETEKIIARLPVGARIEIRVNPDNPSKSIAGA
jgi:hypothetical protein